MCPYQSTAVFAKRAEVSNLYPWQTFARNLAAAAERAQGKKLLLVVQY
jgi:hypothetical protein